VFDLFEEMRRMQERMNRLFEEFDRFRLGSGVLTTERAFAVDVIDEGDAIRVIADLPGFKKEDINLYIEDGSLVIRAERREEVEEKGRDYIRQERSYGEVYRKIALPTEVDVERVKASYNNGVLEVTLPKTEKAVKKTIKID